jgi:hypothetical protein
MRTLVDIPDDDIEQLDLLAHRERRSRASAIRDAIKLYLLQRNSNPKDWIERGYGYWAGRSDIGDGVDYQRSLREDRTTYDEL